MDVSVSETIDKKTYLKKIKGGLQPLSLPLDPPMTHVRSKPSSDFALRQKSPNYGRRAKSGPRSRFIRPAETFCE